MRLPCISPQAAERATIKPPTFQQIQQIAAQQNSTIVEYSILEDSLYIWVIQPDGNLEFRQVDLPAILENSSLTDLVKNARNRLFVLPFKPKAQLQKLHQILIEPVADILPENPEERIIFIPQRELFLVPFVALMDAEENYGSSVLRWLKYC